MNINSYLTINGVFNLIETNIERGYINENSLVELEYAFKRIAHKTILKELCLTSGEKKVLESFIVTYYKKSSVFER